VIPKITLLGHQTPNNFLIKTQNNNQCVLWTGQQNHSGYALFRYPNTVLNFKDWKAHRLSYFWFKGPIPKDNHIHHLCGQKLCVNPKHLEAMHKEIHQKLSHLEKTRKYCPLFCSEGHQYTSNNIYVQKCSKYPDYNYILCKTCRKKRSLENYYAKTSGSRRT